jgi:hypothetical protein
MEPLAELSNSFTTLSFYSAMWKYPAPSILVVVDEVGDIVQTKYSFILKFL